MATVKESSTAYLTVQLLDKNGVAAVPTSVVWSVHDKISGTLLIGPESVSPDSTIELTLPPSVNTIIDTRRLLETRVVTVEATYGIDDGIKSEYEYFVKNLRYAT